MENLTLEKSGVCQCIAQHIQVRDKYIFILFWKGALFFLTTASKLLAPNQNCWPCKKLLNQCLIRAETIENNIITSKAKCSDTYGQQADCLQYHLHLKLQPCKSSLQKADKASLWPLMAVCKSARNMWLLYIPSVGTWCYGQACSEPSCFSHSLFLTLSLSPSVCSMSLIHRCRGLMGNSVLGLVWSVRLRFRRNSSLRVTGFPGL